MRGWKTDWYAAVWWTVITWMSTLMALMFPVSLAFAGVTSCPQFYLDGEAPGFLNQKLASKTRELCNEGFAVNHSGVTRTPLYAAEVITRDGLRPQFR